jgi:hypothetical protein
VSTNINPLSEHDHRAQDDGFLRSRNIRNLVINSSSKVTSFSDEREMNDYANFLGETYYANLPW